jgi:hypothetical protein
MFIDLDLCCFSVMFVNPTAMELSTWTGVGGCSCPISFNVLRRATAILVLLNIAPHSASAADASFSTYGLLFQLHSFDAACWGAPVESLRLVYCCSLLVPSKPHCINSELLV